MDIISPQERVENLPFEPASVETHTDWPFLRLEDYRHLPPSDLIVPPMAYHIVAFHYKPPVGLLRHRSDGRWEESQIGQFEVTYVPAYCENRWQFDGRQPHCLHILLHDDFLKNVILRTWDIDPQTVQLQSEFLCSDLFLQRLAFQFHHVVRQRTQCDIAYAESLSLSLTEQLLKQYTAVPALSSSNHQLSEQQLRIVIDYMQSHLPEQITIESMASLLTLSRFHFSRMFRSTTGLSPYQFLVNLRLEKSVKLLVNQPRLPISQIAYEVGFADQSHLTRHFRQKYGLTPRILRRNYL